MAQTYPVKPIRLVVPYPPGGTPDMQGRLFAEKLRPRLNQAVIVENRPGGNASIGMTFVARAAPDGYTLVIATVGPWTVNPYLYELPYDTLTDLAPVVHATSSAGVLAVHPSVPARSVKDLIAVARANPGMLDYGSAGVGGFGHMCGALFSMLTNTKMTHIPFKGVAAAMIDTVAGRVPVSFNVAAVTIPLVQTGKLRALATTGATRMETLPDLPTIAEGGVPGYENSTWIGIGAPARTPAPVIERLHNEFMAVLQMPDVREALRAQGAVVTGWTPERFRDYLKVELAKYGKIVKAANIKNE
jgi:tripartite-type tricarboxylate transporter receptor subunit TctC